MSKNPLLGSVAHAGAAARDYSLTTGWLVGCCSLVGLYITAAYRFTASTSFTNPAVTIARALSDTFAAIPPADVAPFILAQLAGAGRGLLSAAG